MASIPIADIRVQGMKIVGIKRIKIGVSFYFKGETVLYTFALMGIPVFYRAAGAFAAATASLFNGELCDEIRAYRLISFFKKAAGFNALTLLNKRGRSTVRKLLCSALRTQNTSRFKGELTDIFHAYKEMK